MHSSKMEENKGIGLLCLETAVHIWHMQTPNPLSEVIPACQETWEDRKQGDTSSWISENYKKSHERHYKQKQ